jgi:hypothetical protein
MESKLDKNIQSTETQMKSIEGKLDQLIRFNEK